MDNLVFFICIERAYDLERANFYSSGLLTLILHIHVKSRTFYLSGGLELLGIFFFRSNGHGHACELLGEFIGEGFGDPGRRKVLRMDLTLRYVIERFETNECVSFVCIGLAATEEIQGLLTRLFIFRNLEKMEDIIKEVLSLKAHECLQLWHVILLSLLHGL